MRLRTIAPVSIGVLGLVAFVAVSGAERIVLQTGLVCAMAIVSFATRLLSLIHI